MEEPRYHLHDNERLSEGVVRILAVRTDRPPDDIEPLYTSLDPDALDDLFDQRNSHGRVSFTHGDFRITAYSDGEIRIQPDE